MVAALYRRYRPENFAEMIGQQQVTEPLMTALRTGRINHAYLFSGPRGCGKTSSARILARCLNCAQGPTPTPCGECDSCRELGRDGGGSLDVVEIDAASHGGVDDARDLRERAVTAPSRDRYKIFIIDEAHMVTSQGFNALLKVVEEPPEHVLFIFATTEPEKVIGTIRSRTHHYPFRLIAPATMLSYVGEICEHENVTAESGVLPLVVRAGGGSARDTLSLLDQLIAGTDGPQMNYEMASQLLGFTSAGLLDATITALADGDASEAYGAVDDVIQSGQDPRRFVEDLLERVRDLIVAKATGAAAGTVLRGVSEADLGGLRDSAARFSPAALSAIADAVNETLTEMTGVTAPRLQLELMVARILVALRARFADSATGDAPAEEIRQSRAPMKPASEPSGGGAPGRAAAADAAGAREAAKPAPSVTPTAATEAAPTAPKAASARGSTTAQQSTPADPVAQAASAWAAATSDSAPAKQAQRPEPAASEPQPMAGKPQPVDPSEIDLRRVRDAWPDVLALVKEHAGRAAWAIVERVEPIEWQGTSLRVVVPNRGLFEQFAHRDDRGMAPGHHLKAALGQTFGFEVTIYPRVAAQAPTSSSAGGDSADDAEAHRQPVAAEPKPISRPEPAPQRQETTSWTVAEIPAGAAEDGPGSGWDEVASVREAKPEAEDTGVPAPKVEPEPEVPSRSEQSPQSTTASAAAPEPAATAPQAPTDVRAPEIIAAQAAAEHERDTTPEKVILPPDVQPAATESSPVETVADAAPAATWNVASIGGEDEETADEPDTSKLRVIMPDDEEPAAPRHPAAADRYGESVVREILNARFVGEDPLEEAMFGGPSQDTGGGGVTAETGVANGPGSTAAPGLPSDADAPDNYEAPPEER